MAEAKMGKSEDEEQDRPLYLTDRDELRAGDVVKVKYNEQLRDAEYIEWSDRYGIAYVRIPAAVSKSGQDEKCFRNLYTADGRAVSRSGKVRGQSPAPPSLREQKPSRFDVNTRFEFIELVTDMVVKGECKSVIISGTAGVGKTFTVLQRLSEAGLKDVDDEEYREENEGAEDNAFGEHMIGDYKMVKGFSTPKALFQLLFNHRQRIVVFDDCDSVWEDATATNILKAALDSYDRRRISWLSSKKSEEGFPKTFLFEGKIIFISNRSLDQLDAPVLSRCQYVDVSMTPQEKVDRIKKVAAAVRTEIPMEEKEECIELIENLRDDIGDLNIRTLLKVLEIRHAAGERWRDVAEYVVTAL